MESTSKPPPSYKLTLGLHRLNITHIQSNMCNALAKTFPLVPAMHCSSFHFIVQEERKEKKERETLLLLADPHPTL